MDLERHAYGFLAGRPSNIKKGTDVELGKRQSIMAYERKSNDKGSAFRVEGI